MYCSNCGEKILENASFCGNCGKRVSFEDISSNEKISLKKIKSFTKTINKKTISIVLTITILITGIAIVANQNSLDKKLMKNIWWEEIRFYNDYYEYDNSYLVSAYCGRITFCPSGNVRSEEFDLAGAVYHSSYEVSAENMPFDFEFLEVSSYNNCDWELLDGKELLFGDTYFEWNKEEYEDTWYLEGDTLRIGNTYYSNENPGVMVRSEFDDIPYWCSDCGEEGPYDGIMCPECDCKEKIKFDL